MVSRGTWAAIGIGGALAVGVGVALTLSRSKSGGCPAGDVLPAQNGICPDGYTVDLSSPGCCAPVGSTGPCGAGGTQCTDDAQCPDCQSCINGCCGSRVPAGINPLTDMTSGLGQDEVVYVIAPPLISAYCDWSTLSFYGGAKTWTGQIQVLDTDGFPVPCVQLLLSTDNGAVDIAAVPGPTDADGVCTYAIQMGSPNSGGAGCPGAGATSTGQINGNVVVYLVTGQGHTYFGKVPFLIETYVTGVGV